jgi:hypothetical protein
MLAAGKFNPVSCGSHFKSLSVKLSYLSLLGFDVNNINSLLSVPLSSMTETSYFFPFLRLMIYKSSFWDVVWKTYRNG